MLLKRILAIGVTLTLLLASGFTSVYAKGDEWGLGGYTDGKQPSGNASAEKLKSLDAYYVGGADDKSVYLTFDCGYENGFAPKILDILKKEHVPAAFFAVGPYVKENPDIIRRMVADGHIVANHTVHHPDVTKISDEKFAQELRGVEEIYTSITGGDMPKFYRPPQGKFSEANLRTAKELGYKTVFWSLAHVDWYVDDQPSHEKAFARLVPKMHNGAVILLHIVSKTNAEILEELIHKYREMGYEFKNLYELTA